MQQMKKRWGDRADGYRVIPPDPLFAVIPHFMENRCDSQVLFDHVIDVGVLEQFVREQRRTGGMPDLSVFHVLIAACVRMLGEYPCVNRFICGRRLYARDRMVIAFNIKKSLSLEAPESVIKVEFEPTDTLPQVYEKVAEAVRANKEAEAQTGTDRLARLLAACPAFVLRGAVGAIKGLDYMGWLPKAIRDFSPFHSSLYLTDVGSLGIGSVYHHLYNFGTCSMFCALGKKGRTLKKNDKGEIIYSKTLNLRFTVDERVADGCYFAYTFRDFVKLMKAPAQLMTPPEELPEDPGLSYRHGKKKCRELPAESTNVT